MTTVNNTQDAEVQLLTSELARVSQEQASFVPIALTLVSSALVAGGGLFALTGRKAEGHVTDDWLWGTLFLIPAAILAFAIVRTVHMVVNAHYTRLLEQELLRISSHSYPRLRHTPMLEALISGIQNSRHGLGVVRMINTLLWALISTIMLIGASYTIYEMASWRWQLLFGLIYAAIYIPTFWLFQAVVRRGRSIWLRVLHTAQWTLTSVDILRPTSDEDDQRRSLGSYLLLPRPNDFIVKALVLHFGVAAIAGLLVHASSETEVSWSYTFRSWLAVVFVFEFLVYQSRYMINDWAGRHYDQYSPVYRRRITHLTDEPLRRSLFWVAFGARLAVGFAVPFTLLSPPHAVTLCAAGLLAWVFAFAYEGARRHTTVQQYKRPTPRHYAFVYLLVGASYCLRGAAGLWLGSDGLTPIALVALLSIAFYAIGVMSCIQSWALEGAACSAIRSPHWVCASTSLEHKAHVLALGLDVAAARSGSVHQNVVVGFSKKFVASDERFLADSSRMTAPWNASALLAMTLAGSATATFMDWPHQPSLGAIVGGHLIGAGLGLIVVSQGVLGMLALFILASPPIITGWLGYGWRGLLAMFPLAFAIGTYLAIRGANHFETQDVIGSARVKIFAGAAWVKRVAAELRR